MRKVWGFEPDAWSIKWKPLRKLKATEEEEVNAGKFARVQWYYTTGLANVVETNQLLKQEGLLEMELESAKTGIAEPPMSAMLQEEGQGAMQGEGSGSKESKEETPKG